MTKMSLQSLITLIFIVNFSHTLFASESSPRVENCIANGQFSTEKVEAIKKCASRTTMSSLACQSQAKCFGPISFCVTGTTTGDSLESVVAQCSRTKSAADCEHDLRCFSNVSSCSANGQSGTTAQEAIDQCVFKTKSSRSQCLQSLDCIEEKYPMPARPATAPAPTPAPAKPGTPTEKSAN